MKQISSHLVWTRWCIILLYVSFCVRDTLSEFLQCDKKHVDETDHDGLYNPDVCLRESEGQNLTSSNCTVWDFVEGIDDDGVFKGSDCKNLPFSSSTYDYLSGVEVYPYSGGGNVNLNITFRNIKWYYMQYRQQIKKNNWSCQKLQLVPSIHIVPSLRLSFACNVWNINWASGHEAEVLLDVGENASFITAHAHLLLKIPKDAKQVDPSETNITNWIILVVVDVTRKPHLLVHWPVVPEKFEVTKYNVRLGDSYPEVVDVSSCPEGYCSLKLFAGFAARKVKVSVQPVHELCTGHESCHSFSPDILLEYSFPPYFVMLIVAAFILCLIIVVCFVYYVCCAVPRERPTLLILYDATDYKHCDMICILAEYLSDVANISCWLADSEIPFTESKNPSKWLHKAFDEAKAVLVVASPLMHPEIRYSVYPNVLSEAVPLIVKRRKWSSCSESRGRYLVAIPPYCSADDIPKGLEDLPRILLPKQLNFLIWSVYNQQSWWPPLTYMVKTCLLACWCPGPTSAYKSSGSHLAYALTVANARQVIVGEAPICSFPFQWPLRGEQISSVDQEGDIVSIPYKDFPGNLDTYHLGGSIISKESSAPKMTLDIDNLSL